MFIGRDIQLCIESGVPEALQLLAAKTAISSTQHSDNIFIGHVEGNRFELKRDIRHSNSFLPIVSGRVESSQVGTIIYARLSLSDSAAGFMFFWYAWLMCCLMYVVFNAGLSANLVWALLPVSLAVVGGFLIRFGFSPEADTIEMALAQIFAGRSPKIVVKRTGLLRSFGSESSDHLPLP